MKSIGRYNPITVFVYYAVIISITMFMMHPVFSVISLITAALVCVSTNVRFTIKESGAYLIFFILLSLINPLVYHNGNTILFFINDNPFTLEALLYGMFSSTMIMAVILWFRSMSKTLSEDAFMYIFGRFSPKTALILAMAFKFIPLLRERGSKIQRAQRASGLYSNENIIDSIKGGSRVSEVLIGWSLEDGIITADSMSARGYGTGKRSFYSRYSFDSKDFVIMILLAIVLLYNVISKIFGITYADYYPEIQINNNTTSLISYVIFGVTSLIPCILKLLEITRWNYLKSKI